MKILSTIFLSILALGLTACTGLFVFFQTFNTDQYLPRITQKASLALGRPVAIGNVGLGLSLRGITLDAWPVVVADDPDFTTEPFIKIDRVRIYPDLVSLILKREVHIRSILLESPQVHFILSKEGLLNSRDIGKASVPEAGNTSGHNDQRESETSALIPEAQPPQKSSPSHPLFDAEPKSIIIQDGSVSFIDQGAPMPLDIWLRHINATLDDFSLSAPFRLQGEACLYDISPNVRLNAFVSLDPSKKGVHVSNLKLVVDGSQLNTEQLKSISYELKDSPVLNDIPGVLEVNVSHLDIGPSQPLEADGDIGLSGMVIKNFNVVRELFSHTLQIFVGGTAGIDRLLSGQNKLSSPNTVVENAQVQFSFHDNTVFINDSSLQTGIFELSAKGSVDHGHNVDMQTTLYLNGDVSASLINEFKGLEYLTDDSNRITIGIGIKGIFPHLKYKPDKDFRKRSRKALMEEGGNILGVLLGGGQSAAGDDDGASLEPQQKPKKNFKKIFLNIFQ